MVQESEESTLEVYAVIIFVNIAVFAIEIWIVLHITNCKYIMEFFWLHPTKIWLMNSVEVEHDSYAEEKSPESEDVKIWVPKQQIIGL